MCWKAHRGRRGEVSAGNYVWRPRGNRHVARAPQGAGAELFLKPNLFIEGYAGQTLE